MACLIFFSLDIVVGGLIDAICSETAYLASFDIFLLLGLFEVFWFCNCEK